MPHQKTDRTAEIILKQCGSPEEWCDGGDGRHKNYNHNNNKGEKNKNKNNDNNKTVRITIMRRGIIITRIIITIRISRFASIVDVPVISVIKWPNNNETVLK
jgi:hypothetical protein